MNIQNILLAITLALGLSGNAQTPDLYESYQTMLKDYVNDKGEVNYEGFLEQKDELKAFLETMADQDQSKWSKEAKLAYYINLYNAATIYLIIDNWPVNSIKDLSFDGKSAWKHEFFRIGDQRMTLDKLENDIIRKEFDEPRIHFALVCAAESCPKLANYVFHSENLEEGLTMLTGQFINNKKFNDFSDGKIVISPIFKWYEEDFGGPEGVKKFISTYYSSGINMTAKITYKEYIWELNDQEK